MEHSSHPPARLWWRVTSGVESDCHATPAWPGLLFYSSTDGWWISRLPLYSDCRLLFFWHIQHDTVCSLLGTTQHFTLITYNKRNNPQWRPRELASCLSASWECSDIFLEQAAAGDDSLRLRRRE